MGTNLNTMIRTFTCLLGVWLALSGTGLAEPVTAQLSSRFLVRGERAVLDYALPDGIDPRVVIAPPYVEGVTISQRNNRAVPVQSYGRRPRYVFRFEISSYTPGDYVIPPTQIDTGNGILNTEAVPLKILHETELEWRTVTVGESAFRYASSFQVTDSQPFVNEVIPTELKIYIPASQNIEDWGVPDFQRDGVAAWRFEPRASVGRAELPGGTYYAVSYPSTLSPLREGKVAIGPATLRLITIQTSVTNFSRAEYREANLAVSSLELEARALPEGAPEGFGNAVGQFEMNVAAEETEVREGDPVTLTIMVSGKGNLDAMDPPSLLDSDGWKTYPATRIEEPERRELSGMTVYRQFIRPERPTERIPPYRLVYFDPDAEVYRTALSEAISLQVIPSTSSPNQGTLVPPALPVPVEEMSDILGIISGSPASGMMRNLMDTAWWHVLPAALALLLVGAAFKRHLAPKLQSDPDVAARKRDLRDVSSAAKDERTFYRRAGAFIEKWLSKEDDPFAREVLARRDEICFTQEVSSSPVAAKDRQRVLRNLKRLALPILTAMAVLGAAPSARAADEPEEAPTSAEEAYAESDYSTAANLWLESGPWEQLSADTLYNIGNAAYRLGSPGEAALYWRRALLKDDRHPESQQNLRFLERKFGSISIRRPDYQYALTKVSRSIWQNILWVAAWIGGLSLLVFPATRPRARLRIAAIVGLATSPLIAVVGWLGIHYYPDDARFAEIRDQGVITADRANIRTDAARTAPMVIEAPAGSLCRVLTSTGDWTYVAFTNETRGWVLSSEVERVVVKDRPEPPSRSDDRSKSGNSA